MFIYYPYTNLKGVSVEAKHMNFYLRLYINLHMNFINIYKLSYKYKLFYITLGSFKV